MHPCLPWAAMCQILIDGGAKVRMDPGATSLPQIAHHDYAARPLAPRWCTVPVLMCPSAAMPSLHNKSPNSTACLGLQRKELYSLFIFISIRWKPSKTSPFLIFPDFSHSNSLFGQNWNSMIKIFHGSGKTLGNFTCFFVQMISWYM